ncbi:MAG: ABC transporter permease [Anaerolineae bacterium]|nr:ABC transporter permease [Anaerolineae bacterium]
MDYKELISNAWKNVMSNKSRALLTMLGVIIGVAAVIIMISVSAGTEATISEAINGLGSNLLFISENFSRGGPGQSSASRQSTGLVYPDVTAIREQVDGVAGVSVEQQSSVTVKYEKTTLTDITIVGTTPDYLTVRNLAIASGHFINDTELDRVQKVVVLGSSVATELFGNEDPIGKVITVGSTKLTVTGVLASKSGSSNTNFNGQIYTPIKIVFQKFTPSMFARIVGDRVRTIFVSVDEKADMDNVITQINLLMLKRHKLTSDTADFTITTQDDIIQTRAATTESFRNLLAWVAGVSLIVGGIGIMNIMLVSVTERTREIGLRQAIGATPRDIQAQFLTEALMLSLLGGIIGVIVGVGGSYLFGMFGGMRTVLVPYSIFISFGSAALVGIFFGYVPAQTAAKLDPIVALRHD